MTIDCEPMYDEDSWTTMGWYAKGNHTKEEMIEGIKYADGDNYFDNLNISELVVYQTVYRKVPNIWNKDSNLSLNLIASKKGRGAFEATVLEL